MAVTCYTIRPVAESGWVTFFEIGTEPNARGVFLILGPAAVVAGDAGARARRDAQEGARRIVGAFKSSKDREAAELIGEVRRAASRSQTPLEFGVLVTSERQIAFLVEGRARVFPLTSEARRRWERHAAQPGVITLCPVETGDRYYLGRVPPEMAQGTASSDIIERLERGGNTDGALIINFLGGVPSTGKSLPAAVHEAAGEPTVSTSGRESSAPEAPPATSRTPVPSTEEEAPIPVILPDWMKDESTETSEDPPERQPGIARKDASAESIASSPPPAAAVPLEPATSSERETLPISAPDPVFERPIPDPEPAAVGTRMARRRSSSARMAWGLFIVAIAATGGYLLFLRPLIRRSATPEPEAAVSTTGPAESGTAQNESPPDQGIAAPGAPGILWETVLPGAVTGSPVLALGRVIAGCRDGRIYGLDERTGEIVWSHLSSKGFGGTVAVSDSVGCLGGFDGIARAFDVRTGRTLWEYETAGRIMASPLITPGHQVIVASYDKTLHALDLETGRLLWKRRLGAQLWATPTMDETNVYAAGLDGTMAAVNGRNGTVTWTFKAGNEVYSAPAVSGGTVVFGCEDGNVYGLNARSGALRWKTAVGKSVGGGAAIAESLCVIGDDRGILHALNLETGVASWTYRSGAAIKSTPVVDEEGILFTSHDGYIHAVGFDGSSIGRFPINAPMASSPGVYGETLYAGAHDGRIIALKLR